MRSTLKNIVDKKWYSFFKPYQNSCRIINLNKKQLSMSLPERCMQLVLPPYIPEFELFDASELHGTGKKFLCFKLYTCDSPQSLLVDDVKQELF